MPVPSTIVFLFTNSGKSLCNITRAMNKCQSFPVRGVDRNAASALVAPNVSLSARRVWIEMVTSIMRRIAG